MEEDDYNMIPMAGQGRPKNKIGQIVDAYNSIIYQMFLFMAVVIIYGIFCGQLIFTVIFSILTLYLYVVTSQLVKRIKKDLS